MEDLFELVRKVPVGRCAAYGHLGKALPNPVSGLVVGRWMAHAPEGVPWWRVVARDGRLPIWKASPEYEREQRAHLLGEGVDFAGDVVSHQAMLTLDEIFAL